MTKMAQIILKLSKSVVQNVWICSVHSILRYRKSKCFSIIPSRTPVSGLSKSPGRSHLTPLFEFRFRSSDSGKKPLQSSPAVSARNSVTK